VQEGMARGAAADRAGLWLGDEGLAEDLVLFEASAGSVNSGGRDRDATNWSASGAPSMRERAASLGARGPVLTRRRRLRRRHDGEELEDAVMAALPVDTDSEDDGDKDNEGDEAQQATTGPRVATPALDLREETAGVIVASNHPRTRRRSRHLSRSRQAGEKRSKGRVIIIFKSGDDIR